MALAAALTATAALRAQGSVGAGQAGQAGQAAAPPAAAPTVPKGAIIQKIIVKVNGEIFTQTELEFRQIQTIRDQNRQVRTAEELATDPGLRAILAAITPGILVDAVDELVVVQHGRESGLKFTEATFTRSLEDL
jgi:hypothetical protein